MSIATPARAAALALAAALGIAGCAGTPPPQQHLYRLDSAAPEPVAAVAAPAAGIWLLAGRVALPEYLQRDTVVVAGPSRVEPLDGARWAEPLRDAVPRLLRADLEALRGAGSVWSGPPPAGLQPAATLRVEIVELHADPSRRAVRLVARWTLEDAAGRAAPRTGRAELDEPIDGRSVDALALAHRRALWRLAQRIAAAG